MGVRRQMLVAGALASLTLGAGAFPAYSDGGSPPVTAPDEVSVLTGGQVRAPVLANDLGDHQVLAVCRARSTSAVSVSPGGTDVVVSGTAAAGDYTARYQACDDDYLSIGELTVHVDDPVAVSVTKVRTRPGVLRAVNPDPVTITVAWTRASGDPLAPDGYVEVPARGSVQFRVHRRAIQWRAFDASNEDPFAFISRGEISGIARPRTGATRSASRTTAPRAVARTAVAGDEPWPTDPTTVQRPVTAPDAVTVWAGGSDRVDVLANDSDPQGQALELCRIVPSPSPAVSEMIVDGSELWAGAAPSAAAGNYTLTYFACNTGRLSPGTVTVTVQRAAPLRIHRVAGHPRLVHVANPNDVPIHYLLSLGSGAATGDLPAHTGETVRVGRAGFPWDAWVDSDGGDAGSGTVRPSR